MHSIFYDAAVSDEVRRSNLFQGQLYVYSPRPISLELCKLANEMAEEAFAPHHPRDAQHHLPVDQFAKILADLKPRFIHHPECKRLLPELLRDLGCDLDRTYFDVPRLRTSTSDNFLSTGISYAFHPHRDTWYSAPQCSSTGGFRYSTLFRKMLWLFILITGVSPFATVLEFIITQNGTA